MRPGTAGPSADSAFEIATTGVEITVDDPDRAGRIAEIDHVLRVPRAEQLIGPENQDPPRHGVDELLPVLAGSGDLCALLLDEIPVVKRRVMSVDVDAHS